MEILKKYGAVHGDEVKGVASLLRIERKIPTLLPSLEQRRNSTWYFSVTNNENMWEMVRIDPLVSGCTG